jgi:hypothetical protein
VGNIRDETQRDAFPRARNITFSYDHKRYSRQTHKPSLVIIMDSPSHPTLSRIALGALDVNKHINSPQASPKKSPTKKHSFVFSDKSEQPPACSLKEQLLESSLPVSKPASPVSVISASPSRIEKRKEAPTSVTGRGEDVLCRAKFARVETRSAASESPETETVDAAGKVASTDGDEEFEVRCTYSHRT